MAQKRYKQPARQAIAQYFAVAKRTPAYAHHLIRLARTYALRYKVAFTKQQKAQYCKVCNTLITPDNMRVRVHRNKVIRLCKQCKTFKRVPIR